jgi:CRISPR-associated protein Cas5t
MIMQALKIKLYQPTAHYRMPFTYQRRHTYPIPPYSTVIGFLCNMLGIDYQGNEQFQKLMNCKLSVSGKFYVKLTEYIWFRNLSVKAHEGYFGSTLIREKNGEINHVGGQSPMRIDVLENVRLNIHITAEDESFLYYLKESIINPVHRFEVIHLGRAEDWIVFEEIEMTDLKVNSMDKNYNHFFWIPQHLWKPETVDFDFEKSDGLFYNLPVFSSIKDYEHTYDRNGERSFKYLRAKLNDGAIIGMNYLFDGEVPVFFADLKKSE